MGGYCMDISYLGGASFILRGERVVAINPTGQPLKGALSLYSTRQKDPKLIVNGPGEYEIGDVMILTLENRGAEPFTLIHAVDLDRLAIVHLGERAAGLTQAQIEALGRVDILLVDTANPKAAQVAVTDF